MKQNTVLLITICCIILFASCMSSQLSITKVYKDPPEGVFINKNTKKIFVDKFIDKRQSYYRNEFGDSTIIIEKDQVGMYKYKIYGDKPAYITNLTDVVQSSFYDVSKVEGVTLASSAAESNLILRGDILSYWFFTGTTWLASKYSGIIPSRIKIYLINPNDDSIIWSDVFQGEITEAEALGNDKVRMLDDPTKLHSRVLNWLLQRAIYDLLNNSNFQEFVTN